VKVIVWREILSGEEISLTGLSWLAEPLFSKKEFI
jgi:hypothetical protein